MQTVVHSVFEVNVLSAKWIEYGSGFYAGTYFAKRQKDFYDSPGRRRNVIYVVNHIDTVAGKGEVFVHGNTVGKKTDFFQ